MQSNSGKTSYKPKIPRMASITAPACYNCGKSVYHNEMITYGTESWHKWCFKCTHEDCGKILNLISVRAQDNKIFCQSHMKSHVKLTQASNNYKFDGNKEYAQIVMQSSQFRGNKGGENTVKNENKTPLNLTNSNIEKCFKCGKSVYFAEKLLAGESVWHSQCFRCFDCNTKLHLNSFQRNEKKFTCENCFRRGKIDIASVDIKQDTTLYNEQLILQRKNSKEVNAVSQDEYKHLNEQLQKTTSHISQTISEISDNYSTTNVDTDESIHEKITDQLLDKINDETKNVDVVVDFNL
ncbi:hypothetical protein A3Q56_00603 [Intoshia linei]|uniref:LIM zinc-binding domain-containing protein n=1 Tax=Intoshia linei TaxID=1819745 RepID=A0A177BBC8_9BILA|nr:hypothetical protein A3Q56_00603 [Intoshia linei]